MDILLEVISEFDELVARYSDLCKFLETHPLEYENFCQDKRRDDATSLLLYACESAENLITKIDQLRIITSWKLISMVRFILEALNAIEKLFSGEIKKQYASHIFGYIDVELEAMQKRLDKLMDLCKKSE
jgi:hypothetical protein